MSRGGTVARRRLAIPALASALFVFLVSELAAVGLLPEISASLRTSPEQVAALLGVYALVAAVAGIPATVICRRASRRTVLVGSLALLAAGQIGFALAPSLEIALVARGAVAVCHVVLWAVAPLAAAETAPPERASSAAGSVFLGSSTALFAGLPLFTALGQAAGWRIAAAILAAFALLTAIVLYVALGRATPSAPAEPTPSSATTRLPVPWRGTIIVAAATLLATLGANTCYPFLSQYAARAGVVGLYWSVVLAIGGGLGAVAVVLVSRRMDTTHRGATAVVLISTAAAALGLGGQMPVVVVIAVVGFLAMSASLPVVLQSAVVRVAGVRGEVSSSIYVVAYQIGIAGGTGLGATLGTLAPLVGAVGIVLAAPVMALLDHIQEDPG